MSTNDEVLDIALEQMEYQHMMPGDRRNILTKWFGIPMEQTIEVIEERVFEMGQGELPLE